MFQWVNEKFTGLCGVSWVIRTYCSQFCFAVARPRWNVLVTTLIFLSRWSDVFLKCSYGTQRSAERHQYSPNNRRDLYVRRGVQIFDTDLVAIFEPRVSTVDFIGCFRCSVRPFSDSFRPCRQSCVNVAFSSCPCWVCWLSYAYVFRLSFKDS